MSRNPFSSSFSGRAVLRLEALEWRDCPSDYLGGDSQPDPYSAPAVMAPAAPRIVNYTAEEVANGLFIITGQVTDANPGGLTITFGGDLPSGQGLTTTTNADGTFSVVIQTKIDGTEAGFLTAQTTNAQGVTSNEAVVFINPTIP